MRRRHPGAGWASSSSAYSGCWRCVTRMRRTSTAEGRRLLDHAIFTTFVDCRDLGGEARASALLTPPLLTPEANAAVALPAPDGDGTGTDAPAAPGATESSPRD